MLPAGSGKLLVAGGYGQGSMLVMRLTKKGRLDVSFGKRGVATVEAGDIAHSMALGEDGTVWLGSSNQNVAGRPMVVSRLTADGEPDSTFGSAGSVQTIFWDPVQASSAGVTGLAPTADGGVTGFGHIDYIGGSGGSSGGHGSAGVFQLTAAGQPAAAFGGGGNVQVDFLNQSGSFAQWFPCAFGLDSQGRIAVTGEGFLDGANGVLTARLTPAGALDSTYGAAGNGRAFVPGGRGDSNTTCGGTVAATGTLTMGVGPLLAQLTPEGAGDTAFGPQGALDVTKPKRVEINALEPAGDGRIVVAGAAKNAIYVARYRVPAG